ncbi:hypothetical protein C1H46_043621 [Malus baccata]|uniref:CRIB domain-containing protein n=1 Tax=Malus baccata TaxID=106549 RepID=A0A540K9G7_MALBA|nr:hypothetical protein C1H46_043621 [Malus baccata]
MHDLMTVDAYYLAIILGLRVHSYFVVSVPSSFASFAHIYHLGYRFLLLYSVINGAFCYWGNYNLLIF